MAYSLHNHCLCRVGALVAYLARSINPRCTQPDWDTAVEQFSLLFFLQLLSDKRGAEISQKLHQIVELISRIEGLLQSWSSTPLQVTSVCVGIFQIFVVCWSKGWIVHKQVDIVKLQLTWAQSGQTDPHAFTVLFCVLFLCPSYIRNVTRSEQKLHHSACSCPRRLHVWGRSQFTKHSLTLQEKALHFFFWISHCMLAVGDLDLVATFSELSLGCSDCRV